MPVVMAKKRFQGSVGRYNPGEFFDCDPEQAKSLEAAGVIQILEADLGNAPSSSMQSEPLASLPPAHPQEDATSTDAGDSSHSQ